MSSVTYVSATAKATEVLARRRFVTLSASGEVAYPADETDLVFGVTVCDCAEDELATLIASGSGVVVDAAESISAGEMVMSDSDGKAVVATGFSDMWICGYAEADSIGGIVRIRLDPKYFATDAT